MKSISQKKEQRLHHASSEFADEIKKDLDILESVLSAQSRPKKLSKPPASSAQFSESGEQIILSETAKEK